MGGRSGRGGQPNTRPYDPTTREVEAARATLERLEPAAAQAALADGAVLVDTRCTEQREADGYVAGSVHIPLSILYWRLDPTSGYDHPAVSGRDRRLILMCAHGYSSSIAAASNAPAAAAMTAERTP